MVFRKEMGRFLSADGKTQAACYFYEPETGEVRGVVQISHGMCEYLGRYEDFAAYLCRKGFAVCGNDHLGHGHTAPSEAELGFFAEKGGDALLPEDLHRMTLLAKKRYPGKPYILFGHSMGSFVARRYLAQYGGELDGAVLCGTAGANPAAPAGILAAKAVAARKGSHYRSRFIHNLAFQSYNKRFPSPPSPHRWISRDEEVVRKYDADPLCNFLFTAAGFRDLFTLLRSVSGKQWAERVPKGLPILLAAGEDDPVGNYGKGVREVGQLLRQAGVREVALRLYPGYRHEILNETQKELPYQDIGEWIAGICDRKK